MDLPVEYMFIDSGEIVGVLGISKNKGAFINNMIDKHKNYKNYFLINIFHIMKFIVLQDIGLRR